MRFSIAQNAFGYSRLHSPTSFAFFLAAQCILILSLLMLGWKITFLLVLFLFALLFCMVNDLGYVYFLILISPIGRISGIPYEMVRLLKWVSISVVVFMVWQKILLAKAPFLIPKTKLIKFISLFLVLAVVTTAFSLNLSKSILGLARVSSFFVLFLLVFNTLDTKNDIRKVIRTWIFVFGIIASYGIWQHFGEGIARIHSAFANPNNLGEFCFMTSPLIVSLGLYEKRKNIKTLYFTAFCILLFALFLTGSRASWLSTLVAITMVGILANNRRLLFSIFASVMIVVVTVVVSPALRSLFEDIVRVYSGLSDRPLLWASCLNLIKHHLLLGVGLDALGQALPEYSVVKIPAVEVRLSNMFKVGGVHNFYLRIVAEMGILALFLFLYFLKVTLREMKLSLKREEEPYFKALLTAGMALIVATFVHGFFEMSNIIGAGSCSAYFWILLASVYSIDRIKRKS